MKIFSKIINFFNNTKVEDRFCHFVFLALLIFSASFINYKANWVFGDDFEFLQTTAIGKAESVTRHIGQEQIRNGRFYPLGHYDVNILTLIPGATSVQAHYAYVTFCFFAAMIIMWLTLIKIQKESLVFDNKPNLYLNILFIMSGVLSIGFLAVHLDIIYPERFLLLVFSLFIYFYYKAFKLDNTIYYVISFILALYATYMKEPVFCIFCVIACANLLNYKNLSRKALLFNFSLILNTFVFLILYYFLAFKNHSQLYSTSSLNASSGFKFLFIIDIIKNDYFILLILLSAAFRLYKVLIKKQRDFLFYDGILFASATYILAYYVLQMSFPYYYLPAIWLSIVPLSFYVKKYFTRRRIICTSVILYVCFAAAVNISRCYNNVMIAYVDRTTHMAVMNTIYAHYKQGGKIYSIKPEGIKSTNFNMFVSGQYSIFNFILNYLAGTQKVEYIKEMSPDLLTKIEKNDVIIYCPFEDDNKKKIFLSDYTKKILIKQDFVAIRVFLISASFYVHKDSYIEENYYIKKTPIEEEVNYIS